MCIQLRLLGNEGSLLSDLCLSGCPGKLSVIIVDRGASAANIWCRNTSRSLSKTDSPMTRGSDIRQSSVSQKTNHATRRNSTTADRVHANLRTSTYAPRLPRPADIQRCCTWVWTRMRILANTRVHDWNRCGAEHWQALSSVDLLGQKDLMWLFGTPGSKQGLWDEAWRWSGASARPVRMPEDFAYGLNLPAGVSVIRYQVGLRRLRA